MLGRAEYRGGLGPQPISGGGQEALNSMNERAVQRRRKFGGI